MSLTDDEGVPPHRIPLAADLRASLAPLVAESQALRADLVRAEEARKRKSLVLGVGVVVLICLIVALVVIGWQNNRLGHQVKETNQRLVDCTVPTGVCYRQGQERTAQAVGDIVRISIYVAECARLYPGESGPEFDRKLEQCTYQRLAAGNAARQPPGPGPSPLPGPGAPTATPR